MFELTDQAFTLVRPLLPADSRHGKPWRDHRQVLGGILWKLHTPADRGAMCGAATTTTTAPAAPWAASTTPAWSAAAAPPRSRP